MIWKMENLLAYTNLPICRYIEAQHIATCTSIYIFQRQRHFRLHSKGLDN